MYENTDYSVVATKHGSTCTGYKDLHCAEVFETKTWVIIVRPVAVYDTTGYHEETKATGYHQVISGN